MTDKHSINKTQQALDGGVQDALAWWEIELNQNGYHDGSYGRRFFNRIKEAVNTHAAHKEAVSELVEALQTCIDYMQSGDDGDSILDEMSDLIAKHSPEKVR